MIFIVSPGWDDHFTSVVRSFHKGDTVVSQPWNDKKVVGFAFRVRFLNTYD